jgi:hypothetical protein
MEMTRRMNETSRACWRDKEMCTSRWRFNPIPRLNDEILLCHGRSIIRCCNHGWSQWRQTRCEEVVQSWRVALQFLHYQDIKLVDHCLEQVARRRAHQCEDPIQPHSPYFKYGKVVLMFFHQLLNQTLKFWIGLELQLDVHLLASPAPSWCPIHPPPHLHGS